MELKCKMCGSELFPEEGDKVVICDFCGSEQTLPTTENTHKLNLLGEANNYRQQNRFDEAAQLYRHIIEEYPEENEAYWCLILCKYGIEYIDDAKKEQKIPTCHRTIRESIFDCEEYKLIMSRATEEEKRIYSAEAEEIDRIQKSILSDVAKEEPYDIFICYKETDADGKRTLDSQHASKIYGTLTDKGYKVFFSRVTLKSKAGAQYEPVIFAALSSAKVMLVLGSCSEHMEAIWVRNEWSRYLEFMEQDMQKVIVPCLINMSPYEMPDDLQRYQALDMGELDFVESLARQIDSKFGKVSGGSGGGKNSADQTKKINRIKIKIMDGEYDVANEEVSELLEEDFESHVLWELKLRSVLKGEEKSTQAAKNALKNLIKYAPENERAEFERKYAFVNAEAPVAPTVSSPARSESMVIGEQVEAPRTVQQPQPASNHAPIGPRIEFTPQQPTRAENDFDALFARAGFNSQPQKSEPTPEMIFEKGEKHYQKNEYFNAVNYFKKAAEQGNIDAKIRLADCYYYGKGVLLDHNEAFRRYKEAAEFGNREAQNKLAMCYDDGLGCPKDHKMAFEWYRRAAENGHMYGQRNLAECYKSGKGTAKDPAKMIKWLTMAATQGDDSAQNSLGYCYETGTNVAQDNAQAYKWYKLAAQQGNKEAQCNLGLMNYYAKNSEGVQDCKEAAKWYEMAANNGHAISQYNLAALYKSGRIDGRKDMAKFVYWLKRSAIQGYVIAQYKLGLAYEKGEGVRIDKEAAFYWYTKAATQNYNDAKTALTRLN